MPPELISTACIVGSALVLIGLERIFPYDKGQAFFRRGFWTDLVMYTLVQSFVLGILISHLIRWIDSSSGLSRLHLISHWPVPVQILFFLVTHDLYIYCFHRLQHRVPVLWRIHEAHHSVNHVDWVAGSRSHALEIIINQTIEFAPIILLGGAPEVALAKGVIDAIWGMYIHSNVDVRSGKLQYVINGPEMHRWHHALDIGTRGLNFSTKLAIWDWMFGTAFRPSHRPQAYGMVDPPYYPEGYFRQHLYSFRRFGPHAAEPASESTAAPDAARHASST